MNIDIRKNILENFKVAKLEDIKESIKEAVKDKDEIVLPGLGVFLKYYGIIVMIIRKMKYCKIYMKK